MSYGSAWVCLEMSLLTLREFDQSAPEVYSASDITDIYFEERHISFHPKISTRIEVVVKGYLNYVFFMPHGDVWICLEELL